MHAKARYKSLTLLSAVLACFVVVCSFAFGFSFGSLLMFMRMHVIEYIGEFELVDDHRNGKCVVNLVGRLNKCGVISPRFDVSLPEMEQWLTRLLPSRQFGKLVFTTSYGILDHEECRRKHTGGKILGIILIERTNNLNEQVPKGLRALHAIANEAQYVRP